MPSDLEGSLSDSDIFTLGPDHELSFLPEPEPRDVWCPIISVDDHCFEPATLFDTLPAKFRDDAPKLVEVDGRPAWQIGDRQAFFSGMDGAANRPISEWRSMKMRLTDYRSSVYDTDDRVKDMDLAGVWASLCFPSITWGFAGTTLARLPDKELGFACVQAYNDWAVERWAGSHPDRFIACQLAYLADAELAAKEVYRNAKRGVHAISFTENPSQLGYPSVHSEYWEPFWRACAETETAINLHIGSSGRISCPSPDSPVPAQVALFPLNGIETVVDWIFAGMCQRYPDIHIVLSEAGISWVPMVVERLHRAYRQRDAEPEFWSRNTRHPVDVLRDNFWFTSIEDPSAFQRTDVIPEDRMMLEVDFPHTDSSWPDSQELFRSELEMLPVETIKKICYQNAAALYHHPEPPESMLASSTLFANVTA
ncbi:amidohydrolase family protein [Mycolicibacterium sp.]|uniref:amidohydrolase family protein n=1 Tax=Mycolicibacterium sp. TaxID=2320850 RepID=UPI003D14541F